MTRTTVGKQPIQIVKMTQPRCSRTWGSSPCTASGDADKKCYNTRSTCQDIPNFLGDDSLDIYLGKGAPGEADLAPVVIPSLVSVSVSATKINQATSNSDQSPLGNRALVNLNLKDHPHTDLGIDPYLSDRTWDPLTRGTFWSKWIARNKFRQNVSLTLYEGWVGQTLAEMTQKLYFMESVRKTDSSGGVAIQGKDILSRIEDRKAQAPKASLGELYLPIGSSETSFEVENALVSEYDSSGTLVIDNEVMTYTGVASSANGITFSGVTRGTDNTTAIAHSADTLVQQVLRFDDTPLNTALQTLLETYGEISSTYLDLSGWATEYGNYLSFFRLTGLVISPTSVFKLISELQEQGLFNIWWDERVKLVKFKAVRGVESQPVLLTQETEIMPGLSVEELPRERISQAWVHFDRQDPTSDPNSTQSYNRLRIAADLASEGEDAHGTPSVKEILARFSSSGPVMANTASKLVLRFAEIPRKCKFMLDVKDGENVWTGDTVRLSHDLILDEFGDRLIRRWTIISASEDIQKGVISYEAVDTTLYGILYKILAAGAADYPGADSVVFGAAYIGDADGLLSDGTPGARIA